MSSKREIGAPEAVGSATLATELIGFLAQAPPLQRQTVFDRDFSRAEELTAVP